MLTKNGITQKGTPQPLIKPQNSITKIIIISFIAIFIFAEVILFLTLYYLGSNNQNTSGIGGDFSNHPAGLLMYLLLFGLPVTLPIALVIAAVLTAAIGIIVWVHRNQTKKQNIVPR